MSYFKCDHDKIYYPFGTISISSLQKNIRKAGMFSTTEHDVPVVSFPLSESMSQLSARGEEVKSDDQSSPMPVEAVPLIERDPTCESSQKFTELADKTLEQIFLQQLDAQIVSNCSVYLRRVSILSVNNSMVSLSYAASPSILSAQQERDSATVCCAEVSTV